MRKQLFCALMGIGWSLDAMERCVDPIDLLTIAVQDGDIKRVKLLLQGLVKTDDTQEKLEKLKEKAQELLAKARKATDNTCCSQERFLRFFWACTCGGMTTYSASHAWSKGVDCPTQWVHLTFVWCGLTIWHFIDLWRNTDVVNTWSSRLAIVVLLEEALIAHHDSA